ncbi:MAG TPA: AI-2E family transporter [Allosphingosinicella sp.]|nr:AI-2E family transporter [Allosphingosinicella sp.]
MTEPTPRPTTEAPRRPRGPAAYALAGMAAVLALWFLEKTALAFLLIFLAVVTSIPLEGAVRWLRRHGVPRRLALLITLLLFVACFVAVFVLVVPPLVQQASELLPRIPKFLSDAEQRIAQQLGDFPDLQSALSGQSASGQLPSMLDVIGRLGGASLSVLGFATLLILYLSAVLYITVNPFPLMRGYVAALPLRCRKPGIRAYRSASTAVRGWIRANAIVGPIEAVASGIFLSFMHVPGAIVWASLAFFAEFVPRIGGYIMAVPPVIVALAVDVRTAVWTALFYLVMTEALGTFLAPAVRGQTMRIHPVVILFATLAGALAFGLIGALVGTPAAAFVTAYYREFYIRGGEGGGPSRSKSAPATAASISTRRRPGSQGRKAR